MKLYFANGGGGGGVGGSFDTLRFWYNIIANMVAAAMTTQVISK